MGCRRLVCVLVCCAAAGMAAAGEDCRYSNHLEAQVDAAGAREVVIDAGAGFLHVEGIDDARVVSVEGEACASKESILEQIELKTRRDGERVVIEAVFPRQRWGNVTQRMDLKISLPAELALRIDDGSGEIRVRNVARLDLEDGSGEIDVSQVHGEVVIEDGSGDIELRGITGPVEVSDGSGDMLIENVERDVVIRDDGSGEIDIREVRGSVIVEDDGSGGIRVSDVTGDFVVEDDGSGELSYHGVGGRVDLPRD